ncbi:16S rRNA (cytosine(1402)-N(4))-methyltransferase RsmH [Lewinella sp. W8]|uniref:16S rRNA (cytosine(1402)-N(4))-methyltransferase RsmH n=1 Tax=Lewinella sp. W8 TaxID=2528208 RepID=UPI001067F3D2|nr:16S rRNA (cytosine(1402)-N(4))-methyltransferase RsmH [Lewinella sp. W8]MTB51298.1 16S rRNA (cytosine(1402)-N(4))-methyltransferase RsmH [Lewinella sp. W8]
MDYHIPVLAHECVDYLNLRPGGIYVDVTFGGGGHSRLILERAKNAEIRLFGFDQDEEARANALADDRFTFVAANFRHLRNYLRLHGVDRIDGLLADLGVSSHQFDQADRGFSYRFDAPLDMRMGKAADRTAADVVNHYAAEELQAVFGEYGEVRNARTLALAVAEAREQQEIVTIQDFLSIVDPLVRGNRARYLAQVFQALRIEVNDEIGALTDLLAQATDLLIPNKGRLVVISYHSLEDRITKNFLKTGNAEGKVIKDFYGKIDRPYKILTKKPVLPSAEEIQRNSRARSAKLRVGERISDD